MCFHILNNKESATLWVAKEDTICYKRLMKGLISPYRYERYNIGKLVKVKLRQPPAKSGILRFQLIRHLDKNNPIINIDEGLHSYSSKNIAMNCCRLWEEVYECIIPKGAEYYYNSRYHEYVSNKLIVKRKIKN